MSARNKARKRALDFLYEADIKKVNATELFSNRGAKELSQEPYVLVLLNGVAEHLSKIDELIITYAQGWDMDRMPPIDRNILRIAIFEILWAQDIELQVACDEAVELAKSLSTDESSSYINGVLGRIIKLKDSIAIGKETADHCLE
jgi:N utilization substance protein B